MSSVFLRIYAGLLFTLVLVSILSGLGITIINSHRIAEYQEETVVPPVTLLVRQLADKSAAEQADWLTRWGEELGIAFHRTQPEPGVLTQDEQQLLDSGSIVLHHSGERSARFWVQLSPESVLEGQITFLSDQIFHGTLKLLRELLQALPARERQNWLQQQAQLFDYPLQLMPLNRLELESSQRELLSKGSIVMKVDETGRSATLFGTLPDSKVLQLGSLPLFDLYPVKLLGTLALFVLTSISVAIYILVRGLEQRLRKMERAATRISRGDLDVRVNLHGEDSVGRLAMAFNGMASHIQRLLSIQKEMIRAVSHELRTPVARLRFGLAMVADAESREEMERQLDGMDQDIEELDKLVDEILTYANLEQGAPTIHFRRVDVDKVVSQVVTEHGRQQDKIEVVHIPCRSLETKRRADIEQRYLHRAIQNLVGNACRYANSRIEVKFTVSQDTCRVDVDDDGPGIPEEHWDRIFTPFARLDDSRTRASGGYGLGLSIVRRIMLWHNGRALVGQSNLGGARFSLVWPRRQR
ncbi:ATP-binding protein [Endozoicomonadaceae bacterium StTr2]